MKVLMVGLGSIGQRHLRNLRRLYGEKVEIMAYRVRGLQRTFSDDMKVRDGVSLEEEFQIRSFAHMEDALGEKPDVAFITNVTSEHIPCAMKAVEAGCDIFLEKPVSNSMDGVWELLRAVRERKRIAYVGYQNRFHPCIQTARLYLAEGRIGKLISADSEFGERLTTMHTYEDYRQTYMARKDLGGGPVLTLQIHALDYLQYLISKPTAVYSMAGSSGSLRTDAEEYASSLYTFVRPDGKNILVHAYTDYYQYPPVHRLKVVGEKGRIELDLNKAASRLVIEGETVEAKSFPDFSRNDMFLQEIRDFFDCVAKRREPESNLEQGIAGLRMALAAKKSAEENRMVRLEEIR